MDTLAYLVYGANRDYALELTYSVLSAHRQRTPLSPPWRILLICDEQNRRDDLPVVCEVVDSATFSAWTRGGRYNHEAKIHALRRALRISDAKVALVDTDTCFVADPAQLFERIVDGRSVMHASDGRLGDYDYWRGLLAAAHGERLGFPVTAASRMLNSGVVGLRREQAPLLDDVAALCAELHAIEPVFNIEQFAFTAVLERHGEIAECADIVVHYWGAYRRFVHAAIAAAFPAFSTEAFARNADLQVELGFPRKRWVDQARSRLAQWLDGHDDGLRFAHLCSLSALSNGRRAPALANAWALTALDLLRVAEVPPAQARARFVAMDPGVQSHDWMPVTTARAWASYWRTSS